MNWTSETVNGLKSKLAAITNNLATRISQITTGKAAPSIDNLAIGSAKEVHAVVLFFDIVGFSRREPTDTRPDLERTLVTLNCVIPMMMHVIHDCGGYVEKNTGDGLMALFDVEDGHDTSVVAALDAAITCFYVLREVVNPYLASIGHASVHSRIGIDKGRVLISRIGVPAGSAEQQRSFLTAVGITANLACRFQQNAGVDEILIGDLVALHVPDERRQYVAASDYSTGFTYLKTGRLYRAWRYTEVRTTPLALGDLMKFLSAPPAPPSPFGAGLLGSYPFTQR